MALIPLRLVPADTKIDFIGKRKIAVGLSLLVLTASAVAVYTRGVKLGIDFAGGMEIQVRFQPQVELDEGHVRAVVGDTGVADRQYSDDS